MHRLNYSLCDHTVTIYRWKDGCVQRQVEPNCYYQWQTQQERGVAGLRRETTFLLVMPGENVRVFPGDWVFDGIGPDAKAIDWACFVPSAVPGLAEVAYVQPWYFEGKLCHVEAGRK